MTAHSASPEQNCARPSTRMTIGRHYVRRPPHDLLIFRCRFHFRLSFNNGLKSDIAPCRFVQEQPLSRFKIEASDFGIADRVDH